MLLVMIGDVNELFIRWSVPHWAALAVVGAFALAISAIFHQGRNEEFRFRVGKIFALLLLALWIIVSLVRLFWSNDGGWKESLPLHYCNLMEPVCCMALWFRSRWACRLAYFGIMAACVQALVTPDLLHGIPHVEYFLFFISHGLLLIAGVFIPVVLGWRAEPWDAVKVLLQSDAYILCMIPVNFFLGTNYGFTEFAPQGSILDYMGGSPWYFLSMQIPAMGVLFLLSLPVRKRERGKEKGTR